MPYAVCSRIQVNEITCNWGAKKHAGSAHDTVCRVGGRICRCRVSSATELSARDFLPVSL